MHILDTWLPENRKGPFTPSGIQGVLGMAGCLKQMRRVFLEWVRDGGGHRDQSGAGAWKAGGSVGMDRPVGSSLQAAGGQPINLEVGADCRPQPDPVFTLWVATHCCSWKSSP